MSALPYTLDITLRTLGATTLALTTFRLARFIYTYGLRRSSLPRYTHSKPYHAWALVTGSSDGIGLGYAHALAARGFNIVLHGRNASKLERVAHELHTAYPRASVRSVTADASNSHGMKQAIADIVTSLADLPGPLTVLVNNVGGMSMLPQPFCAHDELSAGDVDAIMNLNARFTTLLTRALLPMLKANEPALILNMSSVTGVTGNPLLATYSATKAYIKAFNEGLARELTSFGTADVEALALIIAQVTDTVGYRQPASLFKPGARTVADAALDRVGCGELSVVAYWQHAIMVGVLARLPDWVVSIVMAKEIGNQREDFRAKEASKQQ